MSWRNAGVTLTVGSGEFPSYPSVSKENRCPEVADYRYYVGSKRAITLTHHLDDVVTTHNKLGVPECSSEISWFR